MTEMEELLQIPAPHSFHTTRWLYSPSYV